MKKFTVKNYKPAENYLIIVHANRLATSFPISTEIYTNKMV